MLKIPDQWQNGSIATSRAFPSLPESPEKLRLQNGEHPIVYRKGSVKRTVNESPAVWRTHEMVFKWQTNGWEPFQLILLPVGNCPFMIRAQRTYERTSRKTDWSGTGRVPYMYKCTKTHDYRTRFKLRYFKLKF